jgi:S-(hydroxymethyl)glutathione dehydrogenase/alcohol dehydrogenase
MNGKLWVDEFVTHQQSLENINKGFDDMKAGDCIRCVVNMGQGTDAELQKGKK